MNEAEHEAAEEVFSWKEGPDESASLATIVGSEATIRRLWNRLEEDEAWKHLEDL